MKNRMALLRNIIKDEPVDMNFRKQKEAFGIAHLTSGLMRATLTEEERNELDDRVGSSDVNLRLFEDLSDETKRKK